MANISYLHQFTRRMASICKKCGGKKEESDAICEYCYKAQERSSTNQVVGRNVAIMPCKKCGGKKQESDVINQAKMLKV